MLLSTQEVLETGLSFVRYEPRRKCCKAYLVEKFKSYYGASPKVLSLLWKDLCKTKVKNARVEKKERNEKGFRLFMCVNHFLFCYPKNATVLSGTFGLPDHAVQGVEFWGMLKKISGLKKEKIVWQKEKLMRAHIPFSLDCIDCKIHEPKHPRYNIDKGYCSHKYKTAALRYELAISLHESSLIWVNGGVKAGSNCDLEIFRSKLKKLVKELDGRKGIADGGYEGEEKLLCLPTQLDDDYEQQYKSRARCRHESFNGRIKKYQSMEGIWKQGRKKHKDAFVPVCVILQYKMENGSPLFDM